MSLSSTELNYLVWRYLQESGSGLTAYAFEKDADCLAFERDQSPEILKRIPPGCLVDLVQKGILYSIAECEAQNAKPASWVMTIFGAVLQQSERAAKRIKVEEADTAEPKTEGNDPKTESQTEGSPEARQGEASEPAAVTMAATTTLPPAITCDWHPQTNVLGYGREDSHAVIVALSGSHVAESVTLTHPVVPGIDASENEIGIVSWSPAGNVIVTGDIGGEMRAWSPDGRLKNVANGATYKTHPHTHSSSGAAMVSRLRWTPSGSYLLSVDVNNHVLLWNASLNLIQQVRPPDANVSHEGFALDACWLDEHKFCLSTAKNTIKVFGMSGGLAKPIGSLAGHQHVISSVVFHPHSKILASCSDYDYVIKIWHSHQLQHSLELNVGDGAVRHRAPIVAMSWLAEAVLASVSMDGVVNVWDVKHAAPLISGSVQSARARAVAATVADSEQRLVFNAAVAANGRWLATGDDAGGVAVWDVGPQTRASGALTCVGFYDATSAGAGATAGATDTTDTTGTTGTTTTTSGICDLSWSPDSTKLCVAYKGRASVVFEWPPSVQ
ncbi:LisH domain-containing protein [[Candida] zeylanoides]